MSVEISGFNQQDRNIVTEASVLSTVLLMEEGVRPDQAHATGGRGATHAVEVTLTALRRMGLLDQAIDLERFKETLQEIESETLPGGRTSPEERERQDSEAVTMRWRQAMGIGRR